MSQNSNNRSLSPLQQILTTKEIHRRWFEVGKKIDTEYVKQILGTKTCDMSADDIALIIARVKKDKADAFSWGKGEVEGLILKHMREQGVAVNSMVHLKTMWRQNGSAEFAALLWNACFGFFDSMVYWDQTLEDKYMDIVKLKYLPPAPGEKSSKGCIAKLITHCKVEFIKAINKIGLASHGGIIRLKRKPEEIEEGTKFKKRPKGEPLAAFTNLITEHVSPKDFIHNVKMESPDHNVKRETPGSKPAASVSSDSESIDYKVSASLNLLI